MRSKHRSILALCAVIVFAFATATSSASAAIKYQWKAAGKILEKAAETRAATINLAGTSGISMTLTSEGAEEKLTASKLRFVTGAQLVGGKPGTIEGSLEFEGLSATHHPTECEFGTGNTFTTVLLKAEMVQSAEVIKEKSTATGKTELLFGPKTSSEREFLTEEIPIKGVGGKACSFFAGASLIRFHGGLLAELSPQLAEAKKNILKVNHEPGKFGEYENSKGEFKKGPTFGFETNDFPSGGPIAITAEAELGLVSNEAFGAF